MFISKRDISSILAHIDFFSNKSHIKIINDSRNFKICQTLRKQGLKSYFYKPYHSWEKGTVENINGLIRRFFPKGTNFDTIKRKGKNSGELDLAIVQ